MGAQPREPVTIRPERPADCQAVHRVNREAFGSETEARLVEALRASPAFIPELSLVAMRGPEIVGHILFTHVRVTESDVSQHALALAPMAVPDARTPARLTQASRDDSPQSYDPAPTSAEAQATVRSAASRASR